VRLRNSSEFYAESFTPEVKNEIILSSGHNMMSEVARNIIYFVNKEEF